MNKTAKIIIGLLVVIIAVLLGAVFYLLFVGQKDEKGEVTSTPTTVATTAAVTFSPTVAVTKTGWKTFNQGEFSIEYPAELTQTSLSGGGVRLRHAVNYKHTDPCDFKGNAPQLTQIVDFDLKFTMVEKGLTDTVTATEGSGDIVKNNYKNGKFVTSAGFIDLAQLGRFSGYRINSSVEGCGEYNYYFSLSSGKTLVVTRAIVGEFGDLIEQKNTYLAVPGVIKPEVNEAWVKEILASFKEV